MLGTMPIPILHMRTKYGVVTVVDPLSPRQTRCQFSAVDSCVVVLGEPLSPRWTRRQSALFDSFGSIGAWPVAFPLIPQHV